QNLANSWAGADPAAAGQWLQSLPESAARDQAVRAFVGQVAYQNPEVAASYVAGIRDLNQRAQAIEQVARGWLHVDRRAAEAWIAQSVLPDERKRALLADR